LREAFGNKPKALAIVDKNFNALTASAGKDKDSAGEGVKS
jgi:hypothetical protein